MAKVTPFLNEAVGKDNWQVDYNNPSRILTVKNGETLEKVIQAIEDAGFQAEPI